VNRKKSVQLRRLARQVAAPGVPDVAYFRRPREYTIRVDPVTVRGIYLRLKRKATAMERRP